jgi:hypothetical protein
MCRQKSSDNNTFYGKSCFEGSNLDWCFIFLTFCTLLFRFLLSLFIFLLFYWKNMIGIEKSQVHSAFQAMTQTIHRIICSRNIHRTRHRNMEWNVLLLSSWWNCVFEFLSIWWYLNHAIFVGFFAHESEVQFACGSVLHKALTLIFQHISWCIVIKSRL